MEHLISVFLIVTLGVVLAKLIAEKTGIADVVWYLVAGFLITASAIMPESGIELVEIFSVFGVTILFFALGLEENIEGFMKGVKKAWLIALAGVILPFVSIYYVSANILDYTMQASIIFAMAFAPTSIGVAFLTLNTLNFEAKSKLQPIIVAAALTDDVFSLVSWGIISGIIMSLSGGIELTTIFSTAGASIKNFFGFILAMISFGIVFFYLFPKNIEDSDKKTFSGYILRSRYRLNKALGMHRLLSMEKHFSVMVLVFLAFLGSFIAEQFATSTALGAYLIALFINEEHFLADDRYENDFHSAENIVKFLAFSLFGPVFFLSIGLAMKVANLDVLTASIVPIAILTFTLFVAQFVAATGVSMLQGMNFKEASLIGIAMQGRAEVTFLVAFAGLGMKLISNEQLLILSLVAFILNLALPILLKIWVKRFFLW